MVQQYMQNEAIGAKISPHQGYWQQQTEQEKAAFLIQVCTMYIYIHTYIHTRAFVGTIINIKQ
jgi:hypothetical protein